MMARIFASSLVFLGLLTVFSTTRLEGQTIPSPFRYIETRQEAGAFVGFSRPGTGQLGFGPGSGIVFGSRYGIRLGGPFGLEAVLGYLSTSRDVIDPRRVEGDRVVGEADAGIVTFDGRLRFSLTGERTWHGLDPFVLAGGGAAFDAAGSSAPDEILEADDRFEFKTTAFGVLGGGIRWFISERILIRSDLTLGLWRLTTPRGYLNPEREFSGIGKKEWVSGPTFSLGGSFQF